MDMAVEGECGTGVQGLVDCVEKQRYVDDLTFIAQPRNQGSDHYNAVQDLCAERFEEYGFTVTREEFSGPFGSGVNVIGRKLGSVNPEEQVVFAAHYDAVDDCPGADDNGSGTAGVIEAARVLSTREYERTLVVACWDEEEDGLLGAVAFATKAKENEETIIFNYNLEMIGFVDTAPNTQSVPAGFDLVYPAEVEELAEWGNTADFLAIIVDEFGAEEAARVEKWADQLELKNLVLEVPDVAKNSDLFADLRRSDHAAFWAQDYSGAMLTDTSEFRYEAYHCRNGLVDEIGMLDHDFAEKIIKSTVGASAETLRIVE